MTNKYKEAQRFLMLHESIKNFFCKILSQIFSILVYVFLLSILNKFHQSEKIENHFILFSKKILPSFSKKKEYSSMNNLTLLIKELEEKKKSFNQYENWLKVSS